MKLNELTLVELLRETREVLRNIEDASMRTLYPKVSSDGTVQSREADIEHLMFNCGVASAFLSKIGRFE